MDPNLVNPEEPHFDAKAALRWVIATSLQGLSIAWVIIGAAASIALAYVMIRGLWAVVQVIEDLL